MGTDDAVLQAINAKTAETGVVATALSGTRTFLLTDADGDDIAIQNLDATATATVKARNAAGTLSTGVTLEDTAHTGGDSSNDDSFVHITGHITLTSAKSFSVTETAGTDGSFVGSGTVSASYVSTASLSSQTNANTAISTIDGAIDRVASMRADLGAIVNRLEHAFDSTVMLKDSTENARAKIVDTDYPLSLQTWRRIRCCNKWVLRCWHKLTLHHSWFYSFSSKQYYLPRKNRWSSQRFFFALFPLTTHS